MSDDTKNDPDDFPWPSANDRLFQQLPSGKAAPPSTETLIEFFRWDVPFSYRQGYYEAGQLLARQLWDGGHHWLFYPMMYCFRHFLELSTKSLIGAYARYVEESPKLDVAKEHGLMKLWNEASRLIEFSHNEDESYEPDDTLKNVSRCMHEFNQVDRDSQIFRYATDKAGQPVLDRLPKLSLPQFARTMENLHSFFGGCEAQVDNWQEWKDDMAAEIRRGWE